MIFFLDKDPLQRCWQAFSTVVGIVDLFMQVWQCVFQLIAGHPTWQPADSVPDGV
jgi:hypothetical protein